MKATISAVFVILVLVAIGDARSPYTPSTRESISDYTDLFDSRSREYGSYRTTYTTIDPYSGGNYLNPAATSPSLEGENARLGMQLQQDLIYYLKAVGVSPVTVEILSQLRTAVENDPDILELLHRLLITVGNDLQYLVLSNCRLLSMGEGFGIFQALNYLLPSLEIDPHVVQLLGDLQSAVANNSTIMELLSGLRAAVEEDSELMSCLLPTLQSTLFA